MDSLRRGSYDMTEEDWKILSSVEDQTPAPAHVDTNKATRSKRSSSKLFANSKGRNIKRNLVYSAGEFVAIVDGCITGELVG